MVCIAGLPIFVVHKKGRDTRKKVGFEGRHFNSETLNMKLFEDTWDFIQRAIMKVLDLMCPIRQFHIRYFKTVHSMGF